MTVPLSSPRKAAVAFILFTVLLDVIAMGIIIPVFPALITQFMSGDTPRAAVIYGFFGTIWALMQFLFSPAVGALSDRFGRRPVVLLSNLGLGLDYILMAVAPNLIWLFIGRVVAGITAASISAASAYIADVMPPEKRAGAFGLIGVAFGLGFVLGPALGGVLGGIDLRLPFWVAAGLSLANAAYGLFVLPESLPREHRRAFSWKRANPVGSLTLLRSHPELFGLATVHFLYTLAHNALPSVFVLYTAYRYGWDERTVGLTMAGFGVAIIVVQGLIVKPAVARLGERMTLVLGLLCAVLGLAIYGLAPTGYVLWMGIPVAALWGLYGPASQGLMTRRVDPSAQGQLQGALSSILGITGMIGPALFTLTFARAISTPESALPGAPFLLASALVAAALVLAWRVTRPNN
ncbi:MAG: TCR/Tet family MFS transporter [Rhodospirillaceae bacterium]|nr:TCR/Tet family MFS transporter [Rhodospirillaceae bacterium]